MRYAAVILWCPQLTITHSGLYFEYAIDVAMGMLRGHRVGSPCRGRAAKACSLSWPLTGRARQIVSDRRTEDQAMTRDESVSTGLFAIGLPTTVLGLTGLALVWLASASYNSYPPAKVTL